MVHCCLGVKRGRSTNKPVKNNGLKRAIEQLGSFKALSLMIQTPASHLSAWLYGDKKIPISKVFRIIEVTEGKVKAHELRPDVFAKDDLEDC